MKKICAVSGIEFEISDEDLKFYEKIGVPTPTICPDERARRRMSWANHRNLYHRTCDGTGKKIISNFSTDKTAKVFDVHFWFSDGWDQFATGRDFDFSGKKTFFQQFDELRKVAPVPNLQRSPEYDENAEFTNYAGKNKNCYLIFDSDKNRDCYYSYSINSCENAVDCFRCGDGELLFECVDCVKCYDSRFLQNCDGCVESTFLKNCIGCKNCFGCVNLRNKEFYFLNEKCSRDEYFSKLRNFGIEKFSKLRDLRGHFSDFVKKFPNKFMEGVQNEDVSGNYLTNCKNAKFCFDSRKLWDCKFVQQAFDDLKSSMDCTEVGDGAEWLYECDCIGYVAHSNKFCTHQLGQTSNLEYCYYTPYCSDCFGCVGLNHKKFCIFNRQYSEAEYKILRDKIVEFMKKTGEWGEFFPIEMSPFGYNESHAFDYFPLEKSEVLARGWKWHDAEDSAKYSGAKVEIPDSIEEVSDEILKQILTCECCSKNYRLVGAELKFYRKMGVPIPRKCPNCRHLERMNLRNPRKLFDRKCDGCGAGISTTFSPDREEKVFCEGCFAGAVG